MTLGEHIEQEREGSPSDAWSATGGVGELDRRRVGEAPGRVGESRWGLGRSSPPVHVY